MDLLVNLHRTSHKFNVLILLLTFSNKHIVLFLPFEKAILF